eukprot:TRINITY_DN918_c0_g1_i2.p2 TRINITY_DN918_c0_g1~~TRINITY_DN918_c0_g1_i2.p2  ORF type:complete len:100 (+),score=6.75 TRINITY_DN918_c0_g1_i2:249-548(+)
MHLRYYLDENGKRVYTLKNVLENGSYTLNAHPGNSNFQTSVISLFILLARFSPDDKFSAERIELKKRYNLLPTQQPETKYQTSGFPRRFSAKLCDPQSQ